MKNFIMGLILAVVSIAASAAPTISDDQLRRIAAIALEQQAEKPEPAKASVKIWDEIPEWMKPELMVRNTRQFKFAGGSLIRLVLRPDYLKGGTYDAVFTYGPASDVATWLCRPDSVIAELVD